ncbi:MAG: sugar ABC transporter ATP-binding protein [Christensenellales bacterium]
MMEPILKIKNISKTYSGVRVLNEVDFDLLPGEVHALVGENGAGKSTMIKIVAGVETPDEGGEIYFVGQLIPNMTPHRSLKLGISVIYQDVSLFDNLSVAENICKGVVNDRFTNWKKIRQTAQEALDAMQVSLDLSQKLSSLSVGKKQLVAIARAITFQAKVIVMDEPTAALSKSEVEMLYKIIMGLKEKGVSIIYISHKLEEIFQLADRITVLRDGNRVITDKVEAFDQNKLISQMVGRELRFIPMRNEQGHCPDVLFEVRGFTKEPHFRNISFSVCKHEIVGLTGLVGAGRSEWAQAVFGLMKPQSGEIYLSGNKVTVSDTNDAIQKGICYLPEDKRTQGLFQGKPMSQNITSAMLPHVLRHKMISRKLELKVADKYIQKISIRPNQPELNVESLSGGNQQKVLFSRWLEANPKVLIVDEPTSGVDVGAKLEIHRLLRELADDGICVILISSDLSEVLAVSDRILVMREGELVDEVEADRATQEGILQKGLLG